jgi:hypothetical protein
MTNLLLIGAGRFGQNYIKTLSNFPNINLKVATKENWKSLIDEHPDGVMIATQPSNHIEIATYALERSISTMIEKPLSLSLKEAQTLKQYSSIPILVNHIDLFSKRYQEIKASIVPSRISHIWTVLTRNVFDRSPRSYSELWDFSPHSIAMILDLSQRLPIKIQCTNFYERNYNIKLTFDHFTTNTTVGASRMNARYLEVCDGTTYTNDDMITPDLPLTNALNVFIAAINGKDDYRLGLDIPLKVLDILEECDKSLQHKHNYISQ